MRWTGDANLGRGGCSSNFSGHGGADVVAGYLRFLVDSKAHLPDARSHRWTRHRPMAWVIALRFFNFSSIIVLIGGKLKVRPLCDASKCMAVFRVPLLNRWNLIGSQQGKIRLLYSCTDFASHKSLDISNVDSVSYDHTILYYCFWSKWRNSNLTVQNHWFFWTVLHSILSCGSTVYVVFFKKKIAVVVLHFCYFIRVECQVTDCSD